MSTKEYYGLKYVEDIQERNGKSVYYNPYALPLGFGVSEDAVDIISLGSQFDVNTTQWDNPFEFQIRSTAQFWEKTFRYMNLWMLNINMMR